MTGQADRRTPLVIRPFIPEERFIFSDGIDSDFLEFTSGITATIAVAAKMGHLIH
jgi:hypothetical protein